MVAGSGTGSSARCSRWSQVGPALIRAYNARELTDFGQNTPQIHRPRTQFQLLERRSHKPAIGGWLVIPYLIPWRYADHSTVLQSIISLHCQVYYGYAMRIIPATQSGATRLYSHGIAPQ